jgi:hypothetical protein
MRTWTGIDVRGTAVIVVLRIVAGFAVAGSAVAGLAAVGCAAAGCAAAGGAASAGSPAPGGAGGAAGQETGAGAGTGGGSSGDAAAGASGGGSGSTGVVCENRSTVTLAVHVVLDVTWDGSLGANAGSGQYHLWALAKMAVNGTALTGTIRLCGFTLPDLTLTPLVGGGIVRVEIPNTVWDGPSAPTFPSTGTLASWNPGSTLMTAPTIALVGLTMPDPQAAWPSSYTMITAVDVDGDGSPGLTGAPKVGPGYVQTPVSTPILGIGAKADKLFLASRTGLALTGTLTSCTEQSGTAVISFFDSHVVGCHVSGGDACTPAQIDFVDSNRTKYKMMSGTFTSKIVADATTCADARAL